MNKPIYLLTVVNGIPVMVKCEKEKDIEKFSCNRSMVLGTTCALKNIESGKWVNETNNDRIAEIINTRFYNHECWIQKRDAFV